MLLHTQKTGINKVMKIVSSKYNKGYNVRNKLLPLLVKSGFALFIIHNSAVPWDSHKSEFSWHG